MTAREFILNLPKRFKADSVPDESTVFHFVISGLEGGEFTVTVADGACTVADGLFGEPMCVVTTEDDTLTDVVTGKSNAQMAVLTGKIRISNLMEMMRFAKPFGLM